MNRRIFLAWEIAQYTLMATALIMALVLTAQGVQQVGKNAHTRVVSAKPTTDAAQDKLTASEKAVIAAIRSKKSEVILRCGNKDIFILDHAIGLSEPWGPDETKGRK